MDISLFKDFGIGGIILYIAYLVVNKLYTDMRTDSSQREEKLMEYMDKQADTMQEISRTLTTMDSRICSLEQCFDKDRNEVH